MDDPNPLSIEQEMNRLPWYHTIDLGNGLTTPGYYDHRPYLDAYGFPKELSKLYQPDMAPDQAQEYLHDPFLFAQKVLKSKVSRKFINIYDISPETVGVFDLVFCGSVLLHLTDPIKALWRIQSVTKEAAILATVIHPLQTEEPLALFQGHQHGDVWWFPNRPAFEAMVKAAGFKGWEWFSEFRADLRGGQPGPYHAVIRAWNTPERPGLLDNTDRPATVRARPEAATLPEVQRPRDQVSQYENLRSVRFARRYGQFRQKLRAWFHRKRQ